MAVKTYPWEYHRDLSNYAEIEKELGLVHRAGK
jgi:hypothetical protein